MEKKGIWMILLGFFILMQSVGAITLDELLDSYDFSYDTEDFVLNSYDIDKNNNLSLNMTFLNNYGQYDFEIYFSNENMSIFKKYSSYLYSGVNNLQIELDSTYLISGDYVISLLIEKNGVEIYRNYNLSQILINNSNAILKDNNFELNETFYSYFEKNEYVNPDLDAILLDLQDEKEELKSDIFIQDILYNKTDGNMTVILKNIGDTDMIAFVVKVFNQNFTEVGDDLITYLLKNDSLNLTYFVDINQSNLYVIADYYNRIEEIDEENNYLSWPVFRGEICGNDIDDDKNYLIDENCNSSCPKLDFPENNWVQVWCDINFNESLNVSEYFLNDSFRFEWGKEELINESFDNVSSKFARKIWFQNETYIFSLIGDDRTKLFIDDLLVMNNTKSKKIMNKNTIELNMTEGFYNILIEYQEFDGDAGIQFKYEVLNDSLKEYVKEKIKGSENNLNKPSKKK